MWTCASQVITAKGKTWIQRSSAHIVCLYSQRLLHLTTLQRSCRSGLLDMKVLPAGSDYLICGWSNLASSESVHLSLSLTTILMLLKWEPCPFMASISTLMLSTHCVGSRLIKPLDHVQRRNISNDIRVLPWVHHFPRKLISRSPFSITDQSSLSCTDKC